jgi:hypothetical protein
MKLILIPYIALGLVLSLVIGVEYNCVGDDIFSKHYGSPFVFKQKSLATSMEYYFSISGLILNMLIWSVLLYMLHFLVTRLIKKSKNSNLLKTVYKILVALSIIFATFNIALETILIGNGFNENSNYWYFNIDKKAADWGMKCEGEWLFFK